jgi:hypothetical protein
MISTPPFNKLLSITIMVYIRREGSEGQGTKLLVPLKKIEIKGK